MREQFIKVVEWSAETFHRKVLELEAKGYESIRDTYKIEAEIHPKTGIVSHRHSIELGLKKEGIST